MNWRTLVVMALVSFVVMFVLMYMMVDSFGNVLVNWNQFYMAAVMTGAMMLIEIGVMRSMYSKRTKMITAGVSIVVVVIFFVLLRGQFGISDRNFLKSMIPHHGAALLMCKNTNLSDPEVRQLCQSIISGQQSEIDFMKAKLSN
jgi:uncharacterized protein (DUF305 family)